MLEAGLAVPGKTAASLTPVGRAEQTVEGGASDGARTVSVRRGCFLFANSGAADAITIADTGKSCFVVDDQTVAKTSNDSARSAAGIIFDVDASGVWVEI